MKDSFPKGTSSDGSEACGGGEMLGSPESSFHRILRSDAKNLASMGGRTSVSLSGSEGRLQLLFSSHQQGSGAGFMDAPGLGGRQRSISCSGGARLMPSGPSSRGRHRGYHFSPEDDGAAAGRGSDREDCVGGYAHRIGAAAAAVAAVHVTGHEATTCSFSKSSAPTLFSRTSQGRSAPLAATPVALEGSGWGVSASGPGHGPAGPRMEEALGSGDFDSSWNGLLRIGVDDDDDGDGGEKEAGGHCVVWAEGTPSSLPKPLPTVVAVSASEQRPVTSGVPMDLHQLVREGEKESCLSAYPATCTSATLPLPDCPHLTTLCSPSSCRPPCFAAPLCPTPLPSDHVCIGGDPARRSI